MLDPFLPGLAPALRETDPPSQPHRPTSIAAAKSIRVKAGSQAAQVLWFIRARGERGATMIEIRDAVRLPINSVCGRVGSLRDCGLIEDSKRTRVNAETGREAIVWVAK